MSLNFLEGLAFPKEIFVTNYFLKFTNGVKSMSLSPDRITEIGTEWCAIFSIPS